MQTAVGIFISQADAERVFGELRELGFTTERLILLSPRGDDLKLEGNGPEVPKALGGMVGGLMAGTGGGVMGAAVASFFAPGVGPVLAMGFVAGAVAAVGGAVVGVEVAEELERIMSSGLPNDELFFYEEALRQGHTVVVVLSDDDRELESARRLLANAGAEALDSAREKWWERIRDAHRMSEVDVGDETSYRRGFEAALEPGVRGKSYDQALDYLKACHPAFSGRQAFRLGFDDGHAYYRGLQLRTQD